MADDPKVVTLHGEPLQADGKVEPNQAAIKALESLLERAKRGEITGVAGAVRLETGNTEWHCSGWLGGFSMVGALQCLLMHLTRIALGDSKV